MQPSAADLHLPLLVQTLTTRTVQQVAQVFDPVRKRWFVLTPEEHVRQRLLQFLVREMAYPPSLIAVEKQLRVPGLAHRFDLIVFNKRHEPWLLAECKAPEVALDDAALFQLLRYHRHLPAQYWLLSNGLSSFCADARNPEAVYWLPALPPYEL